MNVCVCVFSDCPLEERALISSLLCIQNSLRAVHINTHTHTPLDSSYSQNTHTHIELIQQQVEWSACCQTLDPRDPSREVLTYSRRRVRERTRRHTRHRSPLKTTLNASVMGHYEVKPNIQSRRM